MIKTNPDAKQIEYWTKRNEQLFLSGETDILNFATKLKSQYNKAIKSINDEIYRFYGKYANENGFTISELNKLLRDDEIKSFKDSIKDIEEWATNHKLDADFEQRLKLLRLKSRISRLEELKTNIRFEIEKLNAENTSQIGEELETTYENGYYETIFNAQKLVGYSNEFASLNTQVIKRAVTTPYMTENYSDALWRNKQKLLNILDKQIPQGLILGYNPRKIASITDKQLDSNYKSTVRLIRTEYNLILNDATAQGYKAAGIEKYQILATLDSRTSDICREMDGEIIPLKDKIVGVNYPPFHPNCRTTTIPYFDRDEFEEEIPRYIKDAKGNRYKIENDLQYQEWKNALKKKDDKLIYKKG